jgi:tetratricopeptide (TPR) repeat protein
VKIGPWKIVAFLGGVLALMVVSLPTGTDLGWRYLADRDYQRARDTFTEQLRRDATDPETWLGLAAVHEALGDPERQIAALEIVARRFPRKRETLLRLADVYEWNKDLDGAVRALERLTASADAGNAYLLQRLLKLYGWMGRYEEQAAVLRKLLVLRPSDPQVVENVVVAAHILNRQEEALSVMEAYADRRLDDPEAQRWLAEMYESMGQTDRARARWRMVARLLPNDPAAHERLLTPLGDALQEEIERLESARGADPRDEGARWRLVEIYRQLGDLPRAIAIQRELLALSPTDHDRLVTLGRLFVQADRTRDAIAVYERAAKSSPDRVDTLMVLAQLYEWTDQPGQALAVLERAAAARPADRALAERVIAVAQAAGQTDRAVAALDRLARQFPQEPRYTQQAVELLVEADRTAEAIPRQRRLVERDPGSPAPALRLAQLYEWVGQEQEAIAVYESLDRAGSLPEAALFRLSELYRFQDQPADFLRAAERLLARRPNDEALLAFAVDAASGLNRTEQALRLLRLLVDRRPTDEALVLRYLALAAEGGRLNEGLRVHRRFLASSAVATSEYRGKAARVLTDLGRHAEAIAEYESILAGPNGPDRIATRLALARLYDWTGAGERALAQLEAVMRARPRDAAVLREVGRRAMALSRPTVALRAYRALLIEHPDDPEALKRLGQLLAWNNDPPGAKRALERFNRVKGSDYEVHFLLGEIYTAGRDEERARAEYEKALRLLPPRSPQK